MNHHLQTCPKIPTLFGEDLQMNQNIKSRIDKWEKIKKDKTKEKKQLNSLIVH